MHGRHRLNGLWDEHDVACTMRTISLETRNVHQEVSVYGGENCQALDYNLELTSHCLLDDKSAAGSMPFSCHYQQSMR